MSLKKALDDCLIDFDRRVLVTDLLEEYKLSYKEVHEILEAYVGAQEPVTKFDKRFLVHGKRKSGGGGASADDELYSVVRESQLPDWLAKLQDAESQLYSVEIAGGSKSPAMIFKPMQHLEVKLANVEQRVGKPASASARTTNGVHKTNGVAPETSKKAAVKSEPAKTSPIKNEKLSASKDKSPSDVKNTSPKGQASKTKTGSSGAAKKGSINSFFTAAAAGSKQNDVKATPSKASTSTMDNFFKKQQPGAKKSPPKDSKKPTSAPLKKEEPSTVTAKKQSPANTSVQLFEGESGDSSDEEEKLDKIRRKVIGSDNESDQEKPSTNTKRRRIVDSEDEDDEQPPKKTAEEPAVVDVEEMESEPANETYLDDEGFVITQRKPVKAAPPPAKKKVSPKATAPANKKKSPPSTGKGAGDGTKTKQAGIMSFFTKK
ncbi:nucleolin 2 [Drosophila serrata]|uniref:nucleolin 2 n=1 Tax=Drosophila serrata TaxID=7274 RepID=UPI000A1CFBAF|nr:nucleolin 2 [Drosophila serrata]